MGVNSLPKTVTRQRRYCDLNPGPSAPESITLTTRLPSRPQHIVGLMLFLKRTRKSRSVTACAGLVSCIIHLTYHAIVQCG